MKNTIIAILLVITIPFYCNAQGLLDKFEALEERVTKLEQENEMLKQMGLKNVRIATGKTTPMSTAWEKDLDIDDALYLNVNTKSGNFTSTPHYFAVIQGKSRHWETTGISSIYYPSPSGFRLYIKYQNGVTPDFANSEKNQWHIVWFGIENVPTE